MRFSLKFLALGVCLWMVGCADPYGHEKQHSEPIQLSFTQVDGKYEDLIQEDMELLARVEIEEISSSEPDFRRIMDIPEFTGRAMNEWLRARMSMVVGENFSTKGLDYESGRYNPQVFAGLDFAPVGLTIVMSNIGAGLYLDTVDSGKIYTVNGKRITSPRDGVFKIGAGLFNLHKSLSKTSRAARLIRGNTYFHEARHDDGNKKGGSLAFTHSDCPSTHPYGKQPENYACDNNANGPYRVEWVVAQHFYKACAKCPAADREVIRTEIADYASRTLDESRFLDSRPERNL